MKGDHKITEPHRESGKIYCDTNDILCKPPPLPLINYDQSLFQP